MKNTRRIRLWSSIACVAGGILIIGALIAWKAGTGQPVPARTPRLLRECAEEVGITFKMRFLPFEQGEVFKINLYDHGCGLAVGDIDGDGFDDVYFTNQLGANALFRNRGDGTFEDISRSAGVELGDRICVAATFVDYDNDGKQDLYVTSTRGGNVLFRNMGSGAFRDVTKEAGLTHVGHSQTGVFFDFDNDGFLDLFLTNTAEWTTDAYDKHTHYFVGKGADGFSQVIHSRKESNVLYRNNGNGTFANATAGSGLQGLGWAGDAVAFDYNGDHRPDLFVSNMFGRCQLYRNEGGGKFTDVTLNTLGQTPWGGVGVRTLDADNDGLLDLFVVDMHSDMWMGPDFNHDSLAEAKRFSRRKFNYLFGPRAERDPLLIQDEIVLGRQVGFKHEELMFGNAYFKNLGTGKFTEISNMNGLETFWPWGIADGDFNNDGWLDAFIPSGMGYPFYYWPNYLMMNEGDGTFVDRAEAMGVEPPARGIHLDGKIRGKPATRSSRCAATGDFDGDGRLEIVVNNFNDAPYFFKNETPKKNHIALRLRGTSSNRDAIGSVVRLHHKGKIQTRQVHGVSGYLSQSTKTVHFGMGDAGDYDKIEITWPGGETQVVTGLAVNTCHDVVQQATRQTTP